MPFPEAKRDARRNFTLMALSHLPINALGVNTSVINYYLPALASLWLVYVT
jgi:hypothetical protein